MGIKTTLLGQQDHGTGHQWVRYSNPRNGQIQLDACEYCGTMLKSIRASKPCAPKHARNPMESRGWVVK